VTIIAFSSAKHLRTIEHLEKSIAALVAGPGMQPIVRGFGEIIEIARVSEEIKG
jgi:hypothetical protein